MTTVQEYLDFLYLHAFPMIDQLEEEAEIEYWHLVNHGDNLHVRLSIGSDSQMKKVTRFLDKHNISKKAPERWNTYNRPELGARLGCQALLQLYSAQSEFVRDMVYAIYWLREKSADQATEKLILNMIHTVPIYTSHALLNIFPFDPYYEASSHLREAEFRFRALVKSGALPQAAESVMDKIRDANQELHDLLQR